MRTIQQDLKSNNLSLNEAIDMAQNRDVYIWQSALRTLERCMSEMMLTSIPQVGSDATGI